MQKIESQRNQVQKLPTQRQSSNAALESPQSERVTQLEAMVEISPQAGKQAQLAAMVDASPAMAVQRKAISAIHNSSNLTAQRQQLDSLTGETAQSAEAFAKPGASIQLSPGSGQTGGREGDEWDPGPGQGEQAPPTPRPGQGGQERPPPPETESLIQDGYSPRAGEERDETAQLVKAEPLSQLKVAQCADAPARPNNTGLPDNLKSGIESLSGMSMDNVKVHYNSSQPAQLNALAYAQGTDIHVAPGQEQHLPHEAWHVVQQAQGRVKPTMQMKNGVPVNDDQGLEREADVMGAQALGLVQNKRMSSSFSSVYQKATNKLAQLVRVVNNTANFTFDNQGVKTQPVAHPSNPVGRSAWVNQMIGASLITHANNNANYESGHQVAARFHGDNNGDNIAAWPDRIEDAYSLDEDRIDGGAGNMHGANPEPTRVDETGVLSVDTTYEAANVLRDSMATAAWNALAVPLALQTNWVNLNPNVVAAAGRVAGGAALPGDVALAAALNPPNVPTQVAVEAALQNKFGTQQQQVTDGNLATTTTMTYAAQNNGVANLARSFVANTGAIAPPTWSNSAPDWTTFLKIAANKPRIVDGGNYRLELP